jgi:hypothetical protein
MSIESVSQVARRWVDLDSFHMLFFEVGYVACDNFYNGIEKGTPSVHHIWC